MSREIYLDNAASTPIDRRVQKEIIRGMTFEANPSSFNDEGRAARKELETARLKIARFLGAHSDEIVFTSSGSEANNLAIKGLAQTSKKKNEILTTPIEHPSVSSPIKELENWGFVVKYLKVNKEGVVDLEDLKNKLTKKTMLISVMYANNEIGTIEPIKKISEVIKQHNKKLEIENWKLKIHETKRVLFHVDACQATEYLDMNVNRLGVDLLTFNGTKIYGPRGIGVLYIRRGVAPTHQVSGGDQEFGLRAGTENLPAILGLAKAISLIKKSESGRLSKLRDYFIDQIKNKIPEVRLNGPEGDLRLPNNINISIPNLSSENILLELDKYKIYAGSGSACTARSVEPSHVLKAIGVGGEYINGAIRFSIGRQTERKDIDYVIKKLIIVVAVLKKRYKNRSYSSV